MSSSFVHFFSRWRSSFLHSFSRYTRHIWLYFHRYCAQILFYVHSVRELNVNEGFIHNRYICTQIFRMRTLTCEHARSFVHYFTSLCVFSETLCLLPIILLHRDKPCAISRAPRTSRTFRFTQGRNPLIPRSEIRCRNKDRKRETRRRGGEKRAEREAQKGTSFCSVCGLSECRYGPRG